MHAKWSRWACWLRSFSSLLQVWNFLKSSEFYAHTGIISSDRRQTFFLHALQKAWVQLSHIRSESEVVTEHYLYCTYGLYTKQLTCHLNRILWLNQLCVLLFLSPVEAAGMVMLCGQSNRISWLLVQRGQNSSNTCSIWNNFIVGPTDCGLHKHYNKTHYNLEWR